MTEAEYVENRLITDEAKEIFHDMDADGDGRLTAGELEAGGRLKDRALARAVFKALDKDGNGEVDFDEFVACIAAQRGDGALAAVVTSASEGGGVFGWFGGWFGGGGKS
ncbi:MAG: EF-hand domain-containing protein [Pseudomonadota bacterium]|nr:EF-hand domain-containing protein [Pseudomonadota bacterium]